ncbi:aminotransferase class V-fold PLP-dependent enzyme [Saccharothrix sp. S26]|uniref:pyridoxal phosphate-dependent decarboxylase family protein n=1 Tax=Saccharothrix sp. S26 TaxID=2907215 RepID=UPI001F386A28|nr:aminotransferase class V-fold PLP-dependent enzyme [Saccharothrix sp. S26]MCE6998304.1 aminotransferase class V-fold PLP-dependent enzyme [Saccharothrix sp. S26]
MTEPAPHELQLTAERMRQLGHQVVDLVVDHLTGQRYRPVHRRVEPEEVDHLLTETVPEDPSDPGGLVDFLAAEVLPRSLRLGHPGCFAFIPSANNFLGVLGDLLASGFNVSPGAWFVGAGPAAIEQVTARWLAELLGLPAGSGGVFTPGGTVANLTAVAAARHDRLGDDATDAVLYCSDQTHPAVLRACHVLGLGDSVRLLRGADHRLDPARVRREVESDRRAGRRPFLVLANAGTTNTGSVDPLPELARLCHEHGLWLHVDGAHGAAAAMTTRGRAALAGLAQADSVVVDPHKWLFQPYEIGCLLVRDPATLRRAFALGRFRARAGYLDLTRPSPDEVNLSDHGVQLTTSARALKLWLSFKGFGVTAFRAAIDHGLDLAEHAAALVEHSDELDLLAGPSLGIVCFRHRPRSAADGPDLDARQHHIAEAVNGGGRFLIATTTVHGRRALRLCTINPRTTAADVDRLVTDVLAAGRALG